MVSATRCATRARGRPLDRAIRLGGRRARRVVRHCARVQVLARHAVARRRTERQRERRAGSRRRAVQALRELRLSSRCGVPRGRKETADRGDAREAGRARVLDRVAVCVALRRAPRSVREARRERRRQRRRLCRRHRFGWRWRGRGARQPPMRGDDVLGGRGGLGALRGRRMRQLFARALRRLLTRGRRPAHPHPERADVHAVFR